jgi:hypothetical protein
MHYKIICRRGLIQAVPAFLFGASLFLLHACKKPEIAQKSAPPKENGVARSLGTTGLHAKGTSLLSLDVIPSGNLPDNASKVLTATLQGLVARTSSEQIYIDEGGPGSVWKNYLNTQYGITLNNSYTTWQSLLGHFSSKVSGYILYNMSANPRSLSAATSLCGLKNAIAVDAGIESAVRAAGITNKILDVSANDEKWVYTNYRSQLSTTGAAELNTSIYYHLRDYATMANLFTFYDGVTSWRQTVLQNLANEAFLYGYGSDEFNMIQQASQQGVTSVPSDLAPNLSALSSVYGTTGLTQQTFTSPATENVHYVSFIASDGDNVAWDLWGLNNYFADANRGTFNMGYGISPALVDLAPAAMRWYYQHAANGAYKDQFVAGPSGSGYIFPSQMSASDLNTYVSRLNTFMGNANLNVCQVMDQGAVGRTDLWSKYLAQPNISGVFYFGYGESTTGQISFSNGKPMIAQKDILWGGLEEESTLISNINGRPFNPWSADGYTLVLVHVWTKNLSDIKTVVNGLGPNVRVVTPDAFVKLVTANVTTNTPIANGTYKLMNYNSGLALDVSGASTADGAAVLQWTYGGNNNQRWTFTSLGNGFYTIRSVNSGKALEVANYSKSNGGTVDQWTANNGNNQVWQVIANGDGTYRIVNRFSGYPLEIYGASTANGAIADQWAWGNAANQKWLIQAP